MAYLVILLLIAAVLLGAPLAPVFIIAAGVTWAVAYRSARHRALLRLGVTFAVFAFGHATVADFASTGLVTRGSGVEQAVLRFVASDTLLMVVAAFVMLISIKIGTHGTQQKRDAGPSQR